MNINVVGTSGSGKSTLARRLAHRLGLPWIELDRLYWRPNWQGTPDEAFFAAIAAASRAWRHQELWPGTGNRESFRRSFCSRESIILWTLKTWRQNRRRYLADMQDPQYRHIRFVRVRSPRQAEALLRELEAQRPGGHI